MARSRFAVFGAGRYGTQIALSLARRGAEVFTFDADADRAELLKEDVSLAVTLDSTDKKHCSPSTFRTSTPPSWPLARTSRRPC